MNEIIIADKPKIISLYDATRYVLLRHSMVQVKDLPDGEGIAMITEFPEEIRETAEDLHHDLQTGGRWWEWLESHQHCKKLADHYRKRRGYMILDAVTSKAIVTVYEALNEANRAKLASFSITKQVNIVWKLIRK